MPDVHLHGRIAQRVTGAAGVIEPMASTATTPLLLASAMTCSTALLEIASAFRINPENAALPGVLRRRRGITAAAVVSMLLSTPFRRPWQVVIAQQ